MGLGLQVQVKFRDPSTKSSTSSPGIVLQHGNNVNFNDNTAISAAFGAGAQSVDGFGVFRG